MIKSLILTALLTSGVGANATPLLNNKAETKETEQAITYKNYENSSSETQQQSSEIEWNVTLNAWTTTKQRFGWTGNNNSYTEDLYINKKFEALADTNAVNIRAYTYENITARRFKAGYPQGNTNGTGWLIQTATNPSQTGHITTQQSTSMYVMQYQAYQNVTSNNLRITLRSTMYGTFFRYRSQLLPEEDTYITRVEYTYNMVSTTTDASSFVDMTMTQNNKSNYEKFITLNNPTGNFSFNRQIAVKEMDIGVISGGQGNNEIEHTESPIENNISVSFDIPVNPKLVNYFICYRTAVVKLYKYTEDSYIDVSEYLQASNTPYIQYLGHMDRYYNTQTQQYVPTSTPENLNTDAVIQQWEQDHAVQYHFNGTYVPPISTEVVDIPGLMFQVLGMPFTFISTAFNLTLFPGTPYQFNISSVFLMILGILIFIFVLRMILKVFK